MAISQSLVDKQGRIYVPYPRDEQGQFYLPQFIPLVITTSWVIGDTSKYLCICKQEEFLEEAEKRVRYSVDPDNMRRWIYGMSTGYCDYDKKGRVKIPSYLRQFIGIETNNLQLPLPLDEFKDFAKDTVVIREVYSGIKLFEIWNRKEWEKRRRRIQLNRRFPKK